MWYYLSHTSNFETGGYDFDSAMLEYKNYIPMRQEYIFHWKVNLIWIVKNWYLNGILGKKKK